MTKKQYKHMGRPPNQKQVIRHNRIHVLCQLMDIHGYGYEACRQYALRNWDLSNTAAANYAQEAGSLVARRKKGDPGKMIVG